MIAVRLPSHFPARATEWMLASMKLSWGLILLSPADIFALPNMRAMPNIAPQAVWGWVGVIAGMAHLTALYVNGTRRRSPHLRAFCSWIGSMFWFEVMLGMYESGVPSTGWAIYPWMFAFSTYNITRAMGDARLSDIRARETIGGRG